MKWISVNDRLPEHESDVLVSSNKRFYYVAHFSRITRHFYCSVDGDPVDGVTHWCEIAPPQESSDEMD